MPSVSQNGSERMDYVSDIDLILCNVSDINECDPSPCQNGGTCSTPNVNMYQCDCTGTGYTGTNCETGKCPKSYETRKSVFSEKNIICSDNKRETKKIIG